MARDYKLKPPMNPDAASDFNFHLPQRQLIEWSMADADLDSQIDRVDELTPIDELALRRFKKRSLRLRRPDSAAFGCTRPAGLRVTALRLDLPARAALIR